MKMTAVSIKLTLYVVIAVLAGMVVVNTLTDPIGHPTDDYHAVFTDAAGLINGSDITIAGVRVGTVSGVRLENGLATVDFDLREDQRIPADARAVIRYADLLGARAIAIVPGPGGGGDLPPGSTIPVERTAPALDMTSLFNGFKPLFAAIDPKEVNQLAGELIAVFQGESGTIASLLRHVVSVTATINSKDQVIGQLLDNLTAVLTTINSHRDDLKALLDGLATLTDNVAASRQQIAEALDSGAQLAGTLSGLLGELSPTLTRDVRSVDALTKTLLRNSDGIDAAIQAAPGFFADLNRATDYGSWVNIYICNLSVTLGTTPADLGFGPHSAVCR